MAEPAAALRPRVTIVTPLLDIGGTERHLLRVLPELARRGIDVSLFVLRRGGRLEAEFQSRGVVVHGGFSGGPAPIRAIRAFFGLLAHLRGRRSEIIHFFLTEAYLLGALAARLTGCRRLAMSRRSLATYKAHHPALGRFEPTLHRFVRVLLGNSTAVVRELRAEAGDPDKVGLIHNGIVPQAPGTTAGRAAMRKQLGIDGNACVIGSVANLIAYKGHADLIAALGGVRDELPEAWRLVLIGRDGGIEAALREQASRLGIADNILWLGERTDVEALLEAVDVAVLASHEEGFSNALLEMMGKEIATVATAVGGNVDAIEDGVSGLLVPPRAPRELGAAILRLCRDPELRRRLGAAARQRVELQFSLARCVERHENLYRHFDRIGHAPLQQIIDGTA